MHIGRIIITPNNACTIFTWALLLLILSRGVNFIIHSKNNHDIIIIKWAVTKG